MKGKIRPSLKQLLYYYSKKSPGLAGGKGQKIDSQLKEEVPLILSTIILALTQYQQLYNSYRPHQALEQLTLKEYYELTYQNRAT